MIEPVARPPHLPEFLSPPLDEVALGVQFEPAKGYQQIRAGEVWALFREGFPLVEEWPPIPPMFETFGGPIAPARLNIGFVTSALHDRFWFLSLDKTQLIQFQHDRFLHNWRKMGIDDNEYPRFERMISSFRSEIDRLQTYFNELHAQYLICNQAEISYINHFDFGEIKNGHTAFSFLSFIDFNNINPDDLYCVFRRIITNDAGSPVGRLICELNTIENPLGSRKLVFTLTARGPPAEPTILAALDFLAIGRDVIVREFAARTSDSAHERWKRVR